MFGGGWAEWFIIGIVALIVIGPKDLPVVMRRVGRVVGQVRRMGSEFQRELNKTTGLDQITDLRRSLTEPLRQTSEEIAREFNRITPAGTVEPTGIVQPLDPSKESVYETIAATSGLTAAPAMTAAGPAVAAPVMPEPPPTPVMKPLATPPASTPVAVTEPAPAPAEMLAPAPKPKRTPRPRAARAVETAAAPVADVAAKPARKPAARKPATKAAASSEGVSKPARARAKKA